MVVLPAAFRDFKGIPLAIRAWPQVLQKHPDAILSLVGGRAVQESTTGTAKFSTEGEEDETELRKLVSELGLTDSVVFAGMRSDMPEVYRAADAVLLSSIYGENLPTVLIEASASGKAIAAPRIGGIPDIVVDGATGLLFEANDPAALAAAVIRLLDDPELRKSFVQPAVERAHTEFSATAWARRLQDLYNELIERKR